MTDEAIRYLKLDLIQVNEINFDDLNIFESIIKEAYQDFGKPQLWIVRLAASE